MVLLKELIEFGTEKLNNATASVQYGESASVDFNDNTLDTVHETITEVFTSITANKVSFDSTLTSGLAIGDDIDSDLLVLDSKAINKNKYLSISKTDEKVIDSRQIIYVLVE